MQKLNLWNKLTAVVARNFACVIFKVQLCVVSWKDLFTAEVINFYCFEKLATKENHKIVVPLRLLFQFFVNAYKTPIYMHRNSNNSVTSSLLDNSCEYSEILPLHPLFIRSSLLSPHVLQIKTETCVSVKTYYRECKRFLPKIGSQLIVNFICGKTNWTSVNSWHDFADIFEA